MRGKTTVILLLFASGVFITTIIFSDRTATYAQVQTSKKRVDTCITSECHAKMHRENLSYA